MNEADPQVRAHHVVGRYYHAQKSLHGDCFYLGDCDPEEHTLHILRMDEYIDDAESLAF